MYKIVKTTHKIEMYKKNEIRELLTGILKILKKRNIRRIITPMDGNAICLHK